MSRLDTLVIGTLAALILLVLIAMVVGWVHIVGDAHPGIYGS